MITLYIPKLNFKTGLLFFVLFISGSVFSQSQKGKVLSSETNWAIGYVNIGIIGKNVGTVSDEFGNFTLNLDNIYNNDSLRFSIIGYEAKSFLVRNFKENLIKNVYLTPVLYDLKEVKVIYHRTKGIRLGTQVLSNSLKSGFANNNLGSELGIKVNVKNRVELKDINLNVAVCTFDSVTYRLNIYQSVNNTGYKNILTEPIYISFSKDKINNVITFDLTKYSIIIEGNVLIALELYKDLGEGSLLFHTEFFTGYTYHKKTSEGSWIKAPGVIGMYLNGRY
ncbi:MAG: carboxypeptidase-like regulatory domain-containing protein [Bacteroidales bacterium]